jgi:hypothetical protein
MITVLELYKALQAEIYKGQGHLPVAFGDCNKLHLISGCGASVVEDLDEYYLEEIAEEDRDQGTLPNVFIVGE